MNRPGRGRVEASPRPGRAVRCQRRAGSARAAAHAVRSALAGFASVAAAVLTALATAGCVVVPVTRDVYDPDCRLMRREVALETAVIGQFHSCSGQECSALLATLGIVSAATLVVSGSLAVVGNVVYWLEHEANCRGRKGALPEAPGAAPVPAPSPAASR